MRSPRPQAVYRSTEELRFAFSIVAFADREFERPERLVEEHRELLDLIVRGQTELAEAALLARLAKYEARLSQVLAVAHARRRARRSGDRQRCFCG